jgi:hypothetical protein
VTNSNSRPLPFLQVTQNFGAAVRFCPPVQLFPQIHRVRLAVIVAVQVAFYSSALGEPAESQIRALHDSDDKRDKRGAATSPSSQHRHNSFSCHTLERHRRNSFPCHTYKNTVSKSFACHTSENSGGSPRRSIERNHHPRTDRERKYLWVVTWSCYLEVSRSNTASDSTCPRSIASLLPSGEKRYLMICSALKCVT